MNLQRLSVTAVLALALAAQPLAAFLAPAVVPSLDGPLGDVSTCRAGNGVLALLRS